ncbi:helix-turn-helix transcriptional regulator [Cohnella soli]|uniref:Helix-turn-helix transcriptional regulator n=1 Tax=Cohnella soli TaxID=425005 RepID=A0ABW0I1C2_9BACL
MDVLLIISHKLTEEEFLRVQNMFPNMIILSESHFPTVVKHLRKERYKLVVFLSFEEALPDSWKIDQLSLNNPIMILLKVSKLDLFVFYSFLDAVGLLANPSSSVTTKSEIPPLLYKSIEFIEENLCENELCLEQVASSIFVSRCHYSRMFKEYFGIGFKEYVMNKRIQKAKVMLQEGTPVTDVCYAVGYGDLTHFGRVFKKMVGINPSDFRRQKGRMPSCG